jgi:hypothetical protein
VNYYDIQATFRPIDVWPGGPTKHRRAAPFRAGWKATLELLKGELRALAARHVVVQIDMAESDIRLDGYPRASARAASPGIILAFDSKYGPLRYPCDTYTDWEDNLRAVALAMEALRKVDRYGVTKRGEQYTGWKALPSGGASATTMGADHAAVWLCNQAGSRYLASDVLTRRDVANDAYRDAAKQLHPDAGGDTEAFQRLQEVKRALDAHHGSRP